MFLTEYRAVPRNWYLSEIDTQAGLLYAIGATVTF